MAEDLSAKLENLKVEEASSAAAATVTYEDDLIDFPFRLQPQFMLLPHYADCSKVGYVVQGRAIVGVILPGETEERIVVIEVGDVITVPKETYTWWYNDGDCVFNVIYLGDAAAGLTKGIFTYFLLAGPATVYNGFSSDFLGQILGGVNQEAVQELFSSQPNPQVIKIERKICVAPRDGDREGIVLNVASAVAERSVDGGFVAWMTRENLAMLGGRLFGFSINITRLGANAARMPGFFAAVQLVHVTAGGGRVQISGINGATDYDGEVKEGSVFAVKKFHVMSAIAGGDGLEWFSIINIDKPSFYPVVGKTSPLHLTHLEVLEAALNVSPDMLKLVRGDGAGCSLMLPAPK